MSLPESVLASLAPRLAFVAGNGLARFGPATEALRRATGEEREVLETSLASFARDARGLVGFDRLPDPVLAWATVGPDREVGLRRALPGGTLELRPWEGRFTLFRRIREGGLKAALGALALVLADRGSDLSEPALVRVLSPAPSSGAAVTLIEWRGSVRGGRFEGLSLVTDGKEAVFSLSPPYDGFHPDRSHESAVDELLRVALDRARPPGATAVPAPLVLPSGGRFPRPRSRKRRRSGPGSGAREAR